ncbi:hypothetical protein HDU76_003975 [Blyttiomyces sp. JEL0837]|nr:hypothetical protein HDU76_003975 [Blyttiomyces sp. JEL0837]
MSGHILGLASTSLSTNIAENAGTNPNSPISPSASHKSFEFIPSVETKQLPPALSLKPTLSRPKIEIESGSSSENGGDPDHVHPQAADHQARKAHTAAELVRMQSLKDFDKLEKHHHRVVMSNIVDSTFSYTRPKSEMVNLTNSRNSDYYGTNTAYDRFWEARKTWATLITHARNFMRAVWANDLAHLLLHVPIFFPENASKYSTGIPVLIAMQLTAYAEMTRTKELVDYPTYAVMNTALIGMLDCFTALQRIRITPVPLVYKIHLKMSLLIFLGSLPFQFAALGWYGICAYTFTCFTLLGVQAIATEIENPFGFDSDDLSLADFCDDFRNEVYEMVKRGTEYTEKWYDPGKVKALSPTVSVPSPSPFNFRFKRSS